MIENRGLNRGEKGKRQPGVPSRLHRRRMHLAFARCRALVSVNARRAALSASRLLVKEGRPIFYRRQKRASYESRPAAQVARS